MNGYTKGPWKVWNDRVWTDRPSDEMQEICSISGNRGDRDANARLIAAAPELLEACHAIEKANTPEMIDAAYTLIRAAIAKAEGK